METGSEREGVTQSGRTRFGEGVLPCMERGVRREETAIWLGGRKVPEERVSGFKGSAPAGGVPFPIGKGVESRRPGISRPGGEREGKGPETKKDTWARFFRGKKNTWIPIRGGLFCKRRGKNILFFFLQGMRRAVPRKRK